MKDNQKPYILTNSQASDAESFVIEDIMPEGISRVYPYELPNTKESKALLQGNSVSIVYATQDELDKEYLEDDSNGDYYFDALLDVSNIETLDITSSTSTFGKELLTERVVSGFSNYFFKSERDNLTLLGENFTSSIFTINEPLDIERHKNGKQAVFIMTPFTEAKSPITDSIDERGNYSFSGVNITAMEQSYENSRIIFTQNKNFNRQVTSFDGGKGISLGMENHMLVSSIKAKGSTTEYANGVNLGSEYGDIDLISKEKWAPFKMTPSSTNDKLTMYADWFDYDFILPFIYIEKFKAGATLSTTITNSDDLKMVEDMIAVSAGYASSWDTAPVLTTGTETGKIDPKFRVGHSGIKVSVIAGKDPIKVIDGIYENHIRKFPTFETDITRYQPAKAILNALSRFIYSSYAIGKGQNSFNQAYLPWYLEPFPTTPISFDKKISIANPDKGSTGTVDTYVLDDGVKFQGKTLYFHDKFSDSIPIKGQPDLILPSNVNMSNQKLVQTDRKLTLPEVPEIIGAMNKLPLPGDIDTRSSNDLSYIWYLPIQDQTKFEEFMLNTLTTHSSVAPGTDVRVQLPIGVDGKKWTQQEANQAVLLKQPGILKTPTIITSIKSKNYQVIFRTESNIGVSSRILFKILIDGAKIHEQEIRQTLGAGWIFPSENEIKSIITAWLIANKKYEDEASIIYDNYKAPIWDTSNGDHNHDVQWLLLISHSEFTPAVVTTTSTAIATYSFQGREVLFDKQEWGIFLAKFGIIPRGFNRYTFDTLSSYTIDHIDELIIQSVWGNEIEIFFGTGPTEFIKIPIFNKDNETITVQRIIFS